MHIEEPEMPEKHTKQCRSLIRMIMMNINGFPSKKANRHKLKAL